MIERLNPRERIIVLVGASAALLIILIAGIILPYRAALQRLDDRIVARRQQIVEARTLVQRIQAMQAEAAMTERRLKPAQPTALVPAIEALVGRIAGRENLLGVRPQPVTAPSGFRQEKVEVQLEKIRLEQLVRLLHAINSADACLQTDGLKVRPRFENSALLDVTLVVSAFVRAS